MKTLVVDYSLTGNNKLLADIVTKKLKADRDEITVNGQMTQGRLMLDMIFSRKPKINTTKNPSDYDHIIFISPVWMFKIASPLYSYIKKNKGAIKSYSFISMAGGALNKNEKLPAYIEKVVGKKAVNITQLYVNDLLSDEDRDQIKKTGPYIVKEADIVTRLKKDFDAFIESVPK